MQIDRLTTIVLFLTVQFLLNYSPLFANTNVLYPAIDFTALDLTQSIDTLTDTALRKYNSEDYDSCLKYLKGALEYSEKHPAKHRCSVILITLARVHHLRNNYALSQQYLFRILSDGGCTATDEERSTVMSLISSNYNSLGNVDAAYEYKLKAIGIREILSDTLGIASGYYDLGSLYYYQFAYEKAIDYYQKSRDLAQQLDNGRMIYNSIAALGSAYEKIGRIEEALTLHLKSLALADSLNYQTGRAYSLGNAGSAYAELGNYEKSRRYLDESLLLKRKLNDRWGEIGAHTALSRLNTKIKDYPAAEQNLKDALKMARTVNAESRVTEIYKSLAAHYETIGDAGTAIGWLNRYTTAKDSLMNADILREMSDRKAEFALQKKEYEIDLLTKNNELLAAQKNTQHLTLIGAGLLCFLFFISAVVLRILLVKQRKLTRLSERQTTEIERQKGLIERKNKALAGSNEDLQQFAYVASHDLREPLRMISSYGKLLNRRYREVLDGNGREFLFYMTDAAQRMDKMLSDLLEYAKTSSEVKPFEEVKTAEIIDTVCHTMSAVLNEKNAVLTVDATDFPIVTGRKTQLYQLFQNFVTNGLKYNRSEQPHIEITCTVTPEEYIFSFKDNGIGIPESQQTKIFDMFQRLHAKGEFEGTGIGLATCKKIADLHNGRISVKSEVGKGSTFSFHLPVLLK